MTRYGCAAAAVTSRRSSCLYVRHLQQILTVASAIPITAVPVRQLSTEAPLQACGKAYAECRNVVNVRVAVLVAQSMMTQHVKPPQLGWLLTWI